MEKNGKPILLFENNLLVVTGLSALDLHARRLGVTFEDMHPLEVRSISVLSQIVVSSF